MEIEADHAVAHGHGRALGLWLSRHALRPHGRARWDVLKANHTGHLLHEVFLNGQVEPVRRWGHGEDIVLANHGMCEREAQALEYGFHLCPGIGAANQALAATAAHFHGVCCWEIPLGIGHGAGLATADFQNEGRDALEVLGRGGWVHPTLESMARIGAELETLGTTTNGIGPPEGSLDKNILGLIGDGGSCPAHDAGQRHRPFCIGNHAHAGVECHGLAVEQLTGFALLRPAHGQACGCIDGHEGVEIEDMRWPTELEHHVIGDVHQGGDGPLTRLLQALRHPARRGGLGIHATNDPTRESAAQALGIWGTGDEWCVFNVGRHRGPTRRGEWNPQECREFTSHAQHGEAVAPVGGELQHQGGGI